MITENEEIWGKSKNWVQAKPHAQSLRNKNLETVLENWTKSTVKFSLNESATLLDSVN